MKHINEKEKLSIDVFEEYNRVTDETLEKMGIPKERRDLTMFMFIMNQDGMIDSFNITRDTSYPSSEIAMTEGVKLNLEVLQKNGISLLTNEQKIELKDGSIAKKFITKLENANIAIVFKALDGLLLCMSYAYNEDLTSREKNLMEMFSSLKKIN